MKTKYFISSLALLLVVDHSLANTAYVSADGNGNGNTIDSPASINMLNNLLSDPDISTIHLLSGTYKQNDTLFIEHGDHHVNIIGEDEVIFSSNYNYSPGGSSGLIVARSNISFKNINFLNTRYCFRFKNFNVENVHIDNITAHNTMSCIDFDSNITEKVSNITINNLKSLGYHKAGIRINGSSPENITIKNSVFDGLASSNDAERSCHITGISISGSTKNIFIQDVSIANNIGGLENCGSYQQGDGIVINSEAKNVSILNTIVANSKDADFDIKGENTTLVGITSSSGKEARYNLKLWNNNFTCTNCYVNAANQQAVQAIDAQVQFIDSTFKIKDNSELCDLRNYTNAISKISFIRSQFSYQGDLTSIPSKMTGCEQ
ncbi:hypothetical protein [Pseudoalteromonas mariniglutinosa]|uniref:hypothetical protein n=1 Tax=Pseudoalteromonas mariniglutinosa TaxID=206042 RepID=UPI00384D709D